MSNYSSTYIEFIKNELSCYAPSPTQIKTSYFDRFISLFYTPTSINLESLINLTTLQKLEQNYIFNGTYTFIRIADADLVLPSIINGDLILIGDNIKDTLPTLQTTVTGNVVLYGSGLEANIYSCGSVTIKNISAINTDKIDRNTFEETQGAAANQIFLTNKNDMGLIAINGLGIYEQSYKVLFEGQISSPGYWINMNNAINNGTIDGDYVDLKYAYNRGSITTKTYSTFTNSYNDGNITSSTYINFEKSYNKGNILANLFVTFNNSHNNGNITTAKYINMADSLNSGTIKEMLSTKK